MKALQAWGLTKRAALDYRARIQAMGHCEQGRLLADRGRYDGALVAYDQSIAALPHYVQAHRQRGVTLRTMGRLREALAAYDRAIALRPDDPKTRFYRSIARLLKGDYRGGWSDFELGRKAAWETGESLPLDALFTQPR